METALFIPTASVIGDKPSEWLQQRLNAATDYYNEHGGKRISFVVAGRWNNVKDSYELTEAEVCKRYLANRLPGAKILKEDISVETGGCFAFAKPLIASLKPDLVVIFNSKVYEKRSRYFASKIFDPKWEKEFVFIDDAFSENPRAQRKEPKALHMFQTLLGGIADGDDLSARNIFLYQTPFYYKGVIDDKEFFDQNWPGGFEDFLEKRLSIDNK